jgi:hypothetical protein
MRRQYREPWFSGRTQRRKSGRRRCPSRHTNSIWGFIVDNDNSVNGIRAVDTGGEIKLFVHFPSRRCLIQFNFSCCVRPDLFLPNECRASKKSPTSRRARLFRNP